MIVDQQYGLCSCGHPFDDHGARPPYTGREWCEGGDKGLPLNDDQLAWSCPCREFDGPEL